MKAKADFYLADFDGERRICLALGLYVLPMTREQALQLIELVQKGITELDGEENEAHI